jgi:GDP-4-dehydro-6-deoxy-D-mannose reductase
MRTLVTGADGFVGRHAVERLRAADVEVIAFAGDVREADVCHAQVRAARPDSILHLAAIASVADAWRNPDAVSEVNVGGTRNLLAAVAEAAPAARFVLVSSGEVYGAVPEDRQPIAEDTPPSPPSPYAESKLEAETITLQSGVDAVIARPFPHIGPGQDTRFAIASFASQIAAIERGAEPVLRVGNLDARRDLTDVRDVVGAYLALLTSSGSAGPYNVCSGRARRIGDVLTSLLALATREVEVRPDPERLRPADIPLLLGSPARIERDLGWRAERPLEQTLEDILSSFRENRIQKERE